MITMALTLTNPSILCRVPMTAGMGVGVVFGGRPMRGPAGMPNARMARQRLMHQQIRQMHQFTHRAAAMRLESGAINVISTCAMGTNDEHDESRSQRGCRKQANGPSPARLLHDWR